MTMPCLSSFLWGAEGVALRSARRSLLAAVVAKGSIKIDAN
jgi:hypothetical protein